MSDAPTEHAPSVVSVHHGWAEGFVPYQNRGSELFAPDAAGLECPSLHGRHGEPLAEARVRGRIPAGSTGSLRVRFAVGAEVPPGLHPGRVIVGGDAIAITVAVTERHAVRVTPAVLTVETGARADAAHLLVIDNRGNVPISVDHPAAARMEVPDRSCDIVRAALAAAAGAERKPITEALVDAAAKSVAEDPILVARFEEAPVEVGPGEKAVVRLRLRLPASLPRARYDAELVIAGRPLAVVVLRGPSTQPRGESPAAR